MENTRPESMASDDPAADDIEALADFDADISLGDKSLLEREASSTERKHQYRICLMALSSSAEMLKKHRRESPDEFDAMIDMLDSYQEQAKTLAELSQKAFFRMLVIGSLTEDELQE